MDSIEPNAELARLVARYQDQSLDAEGQAKLEARLRNDPAAREYCATSLRFDAALREALNPPPQLEWTETRRFIFSGGSRWELQRQQTVKFGATPDGAPSDPTRRFRRPGLWLVGLSLLTILGVAAVTRVRREAPPAPVTLRNPGFEGADLSFNREGQNTALIDWQDFFPTPHATVAEAARVSQGTVFAKAGRNVAEVPAGYWLTQRLLRADGQPVLARPGQRLRLSGWALKRANQPSCILRGSLRFVASNRPGMIQFEAVRVQVLLAGKGWQPFQLELTLPENLTLPASHVDLEIPLPLHST